MSRVKYRQGTAPTMLLTSGRFSIRQMALAIAIMAVLAAMIAEFADSYKQFHRAYWAPIIERHADAEKRSRELAESQLPNSTDRMKSLRAITYHFEMKRRYKEVLDNPWRAVPHDLAITPR
jgi:hypothetical protein